MIQLTKKYRVVWDENKNITYIGSFDNNSVTGCTNGYDSEIKSDIDDYISQNGLILDKEKLKEWGNVT